MSESQPPRSARLWRAPTMVAIVATVVFVASLELPAGPVFPPAGRYTLWHLLLELAVIILSFMLYALSISMRRSSNNSQVVLLGLFSLAAGIVALAHVLSFPGMPAGFFTQTPDGTVAMWMLSGTLAALGLIAVALVPVRSWSSQAFTWGTALAVIVGLTAAASQPAVTRVLPPLMVSGQGLTGFKILSELAIATMFLLAVLLFSRRAGVSGLEMAWLAAAAWVLMLSELYLALYQDLTDMYSVLGYLFKLCAYGLVFYAMYLHGVVTPLRALERQRTLLASVLDSVSDLVSYTDRSGLIKGVNKAFVRAVDACDEQALVGLPLDEVGPTPVGQRSDDVSSVQRFESVLKPAPGQSRLFDTVSSPYATSDGVFLGSVQVSRDVTEAAADAQRIRHMALYDRLTGLGNRVLLAQQVTVELANLGPHALLFVDLDDFKTTNDTLGHVMGDQILAQVSQRLTSTVPSSALVCRLGGDEFAIWLAHSSPAVASDVAQAVVESMRHPLSAGDIEVTLTASVGIASSPSDGVDYDSLARCADAAMYRAKSTGRDSWQFFTVDMLKESSSRLELLSQMREGLSSGQFRVWYQPQLNLSTGKVCGFEALVRWKHPTRGLLQPSEFMGLAESSGLVVPLGRWVLQTALQEARSWQSASRSIRVAVNLSPVQMVLSDLASQVSSALSSSGISSHLVEVEMTESVALTSLSAAAANIDAVRQLGVRLAVDDFGTGYSSMDYLKRYRVDVLKVDKSFISGIGYGSSDEAIVQSIIDLGHALGMCVVVEGVESVAQLEFALSAGADVAQGYAIARPMPPAEVLSWLDQFEFKSSGSAL